MSRPQAPSLPALVTVQEAAQRLRVSTSWLYKAIERSDPNVPHIRIGGGNRICFTEEQLLQIAGLNQKAS